MSRNKGSFIHDVIQAPWWLGIGFGLVLLGLGYFAEILLPADLAFLGNAVWTFTLIMSLGCFAAAVLSLIRTTANRWMFNQVDGLESLRAMDWKTFEDMIGEAFRRQGYTVRENLVGGADGGVDLSLERNDQITLVQCKRWRDKPVGVGVVRELYGIMAAEGQAKA